MKSDNQIIHRQRVIMALMCCAGFVSALGLVAIADGESLPTREQHDPDSQYTYINPLLQCDNGSILRNELRSFKSAIQSYVDKEKSEHPGTHISVYFRDLNNGPWFGIDEKNNFLPASLLKVPLLMSLFREAEKNPDLLATQISYEGPEVHAPQLFPPRERLTIGKTYTISEIAEQMIIYSDNTSAQQITRVIGMDNFFEIYERLGVPFSLTEEVVMSVRDYASFFRILYNASYLEKKSSDTVLSLLARTDFSKGLAAGVPNGVHVAHKFGESTSLHDGLQQLHDCGIIYRKSSPYLLCVMSRTKNTDEATRIISDISRLVYNQLELSNR